MAAVTFASEGGVIVAVWTLTTADPIGDPAVIPYHSDICVQAYDGAGAWGTATLIVEGKNHPVVATGEWSPLTDLQGNAFSKTADGIEQIQEAPYMIRPNLSVPGTGATVTVVIKATRSR